MKHPYAKYHEPWLKGKTFRLRQAVSQSLLFALQYILPMLKIQLLTSQTNCVVVTFWCYPSNTETLVTIRLLSLYVRRLYTFKISIIPWLKGKTFRLRQAVSQSQTRICCGGHVFVWSKWIKIYLDIFQNIITVRFGSNWPGDDRHFESIQATDIKW
jgi:hypothetical protein